MKLLTALATLSIAAVAAPAAGADIVAFPTSTVAAPAARIVATTQPVPVDLTVVPPGTVDPNAYTYSARVANAQTPDATADVDTFPLIPDPANALHLTGIASDGRNDDRWASRPGTYWIGISAHVRNMQLQCSQAGPGSTTFTCPQAAFAVLAEQPLHPVTVVARLDAPAAKSAARRRARTLGWRATAPLTCVAPFVPNAFACTFTWHTGRHARKTVRRALTVAQDATGAVTITRTGAR